jgi:hypothetical protein
MVYRGKNVELRSGREKESIALPDKHFVRIYRELLSPKGSTT